MSWWNPTLNYLAEQLSKGVLNEMKNRIIRSNIKKEKLKLNEDSKRMKDFFEREIQRHNKRKEKLKQKQLNVKNMTNELNLLKTQLKETHIHLKQKEEDIKKQLQSFKIKETQYKKIIRKQMKILKHVKDHSNL